jgi:hypothetical protein
LKIGGSTLKTNLRNAQKRKTIARPAPTTLPLMLSEIAESQSKRLRVTQRQPRGKMKDDRFTAA